MKSNKELLFERMGLPSPVNEIVPTSDAMGEILIKYEEAGHFPLQVPNGVQFLKIEEYPQEFEKFKRLMQDAWDKISLPF